MIYQEIAARWAKGELPCPSSARRLYYERDTIYSYGRHFAIARRVTIAARADQPARDAVLFNEYKYSVSTGNHQRVVRYAISRHMPGRALIIVPSTNRIVDLTYDAYYGRPTAAASLFAHWVSLAEEELKALKRKRVDWSRAHCVRAAHMYLNRAEQLNDLFALGMPTDITRPIEEQLYLLRVKQALAA